MSSTVVPFSPLQLLRFILNLIMQLINYRAEHRGAVVWLNNDSPPHDTFAANQAFKLQTTGNIL